MKAYLIGGPQDMIQLSIRESLPYLEFTHLEAIPLSTTEWNFLEGSDKPVKLKKVLYRKVYESPKRAEAFAVYAHHDQRY